MSTKCFFSWDDRLGSWARIEKSAKAPGNVWVCEDEDNKASDVKAIHCLSAGDPARPQECETNGNILLLMIRNMSRYWVGVAVEMDPSPKSLISNRDRRFIRRLHPSVGHVFSNEETISIKDVRLHPPGSGQKTCVSVAIRVLRDSTPEKEQISALEKMSSWTLAGRSDITNSMVEGVI